MCAASFWAFFCVTRFVFGTHSRILFLELIYFVFATRFVYVLTHAVAVLSLVTVQDEDNEYRFDGFVVGDDEGSEDERRRRHKGSSGDNKRKRLRKAREEHGMEAADDEDLELIAEAQGVRCSYSYSTVTEKHCFAGTRMTRFFFNAKNEKK